MHEMRTAFISWIIDTIDNGNLQHFDTAVALLRERIAKGERMDLNGFKIVRPEGNITTVLINTEKG